MKRVVAALLVVVVLGAGSAGAGLIDDPVLIARLHAVAEFIRKMNEAQLKLQRRIHELVYVRLRGIPFPADLFRDIKQTVQHVKGIKDEIKQLSCSWHLTPRTLSLRSMYAGPVRFCRPSFTAVWGSGDFYDSRGRLVSFGGGAHELGEVQDYVASMTNNVVSQRVHATQGWERIFPDYWTDVSIRQKSPGEAARIEAAALAGAALVARSNNEVAAQKLMVLSLGDLQERYEERRRQDLAYLAYAGMIQPRR